MSGAPGSSYGVPYDARYAGTAVTAYVHWRNRLGQSTSAENTGTTGPPPQDDGHVDYQNRPTSGGSVYENVTKPGSDKKTRGHNPVYVPNVKVKPITQAWDPTTRPTGDDEYLQSLSPSQTPQAGQPFYPNGPPGNGGSDHGHPMNQGGWPGNNQQYGQNQSHFPPNQQPSYMGQSSGNQQQYQPNQMQFPQNQQQTGQQYYPPPPPPPQQQQQQYPPPIPQQYSPPLQQHQQQYSPPPQQQYSPPPQQYPSNNGPPYQQGQFFQQQDQNNGISYTAEPAAFGGTPTNTTFSDMPSQSYNYASAMESANLPNRSQTQPDNRFRESGGYVGSNQGPPAHIARFERRERGVTEYGRYPMNGNYAPAPVRRTQTDDIPRVFDPGSRDDITHSRAAVNARASRDLNQPLSSHESVDSGYSNGSYGTDGSRRYS